MEGNISRRSLIDKGPLQPHFTEYSDALSQSSRSTPFALNAPFAVAWQLSMTGHVGIFAQAGDTGSKLREWSSLIGIVTAIVGNILISFALNLQRYAHIRLERERNGDHDEWKKSRDRGYGTEQSEIAERRAELNLHAPLYEGLHSDHGTHLDKADPLNGYESSKNLKLSTHSRTNSDSTTQPPEKKDTANTKSYLRSPYWWAGMLLMIIGESGNFLAYGFAPASIVSPLGVVALVSNCIIAPCLLKERFRQRDFWGVVVAVGGACTVVLSAKNSEAELGPQDLWSAITRWEFELYLLITAVLIIILMWVSSRYGQRSILIDLGLVGLFGNSATVDLVNESNTINRRLHSSLHQRRRLTSLWYPLAYFDFSGYLSSCLYFSAHSIFPDTISESCAATL